MGQLLIRPDVITLDELRDFHEAPAQVALSRDSLAAIQAASDTVQRVLQRGKTVYGVNTGFGRLASKNISADELGQLQINLVLSHAAGTGPLLPDSVVRLALLLKIISLARGFSGVRPIVVEYLVGLLNGQLWPCIPAKGSVGASGDLAPLAHLACALLGVGEVRHRGETIPAARALQQLGRPPLELGPKEGLALLNGTQISTALALTALWETEKVFAAAVVAGAMSVDAALGSDTPFDPRIHSVRPHLGQRQCAHVYRELLLGSQIRQSHIDCQRVQDPYSLRCQPQVMGACLDQIRFVSRTLECEASAVCDNPIVLSADDDILSGGNFHAEPVAMAADCLALAVAEIGALSERRIALLIDQQLSQLPAFLVTDGGLNSGFMIAQVTAAALASENKSLAHPACVDSLPTSANQEDHVSMATFAARRLLEMVDNTATIVAIELLAAAQGITLRQPLKTSKPLQLAHSKIRALVPAYDADRLFQPDIDRAKTLVTSGLFNSKVYMPIGFDT